MWCGKNLEHSASKVKRRVRIDAGIWATIRTPEINSLYGLVVFLVLRNSFSRKFSQLSFYPANNFVHINGNLSRLLPNKRNRC